MKKFLALLIGAAGTLCVNAQSFTYNGLNYDVLDSDARTCRVTGVSWNEGSLLIPQEAFYEDEGIAYTVTEIGDGAFESQGFDYVSLPETLQIIGYRAFNGDWGFRDLEIPNSVIEIREGAFQYCGNLETLQLSNRLEAIEPLTFFGCGQLQTIIIPNTVTHIHKYAFQECSNVATIYFGENVEFIGPQAFAGCSQVQSITIPNSVTEINESAFENCYRLSKVELGTGVKTIYNGAFRWAPVSNLVCRGETPATLVGNFEENFTNNPKVIVPAGTEEAYREAWGIPEWFTVVAPVDATDITLSESSITIRKGPGVQLTVSAQPEGAIIIWSSTNPDLVQVDQNGYVSTWNDGVGEAIIKAESLDGNESAQCTVTVERWFDFTENPITVKIGETVDLPQFITNNQTDLEIKWSSYDSVDENFPEEGAPLTLDGSKLTANRGGTYWVYAGIYSNPDEDGYSYEIASYGLQVNVMNNLVSITPNESEINVEVGGERSIDLAYDPDWNIDRKVEWINLPAEISIREEENGDWYYYFVTAQEAGNYVLEGRSAANQDVTFSVNVKAWAPIEEIIVPIDRIGLNVGDTYQLTWTIVPENTNQSVRFEAYSSNEEPAYSVDENGLITGLAQGSGDLYIGPEFGGNGRWILVEVGYFPTSFTLENNDITLDREQRERLKFSFEPADNAELNTELNYSFSDPEQNVVSVGWWWQYNEESGKDERVYEVYARNYGETDITFTTLNGLEQTCHVAVKDLKVYPESVELLTSDIVMSNGTAEELQLQYTPDSPEIYKGMTWTFDDPSVARMVVREEYIDGSWQILGYNIVAEGLGQTSFKGEVVNGEGEVLHTVYGNVTVEGVEILGGSRTIFWGESFTLEVEASSEAIKDAVRYVSDNPAVATVSEEGVVEAVSYGEAYIYAYAEVDGKYYRNGIWVKVSPESGQIAIYPAKVTLYPGDSADLQIVYPDGEYSSVTWEIVDGDNCVAIEEWWSWLTVSYRSPGSVAIKATAENGAEAMCYVYCEDPTNYPEHVELYNAEMTMSVGSVQQLELIYTPDNYDIDRTINWTIDDPSIARIESRDDYIENYGWQMVGYNIVAENFGHTTFKGEVIKKDGTVISTVYGEVTVEGLKINGGDRSILLGESFTLDVAASSDAILSAVQYVSENPEVATVSENGVVEGVSYGNVYIYARAEVDGKYYQYGIWVTVAPEAGTIAIAPAEVSLYPGDSRWLQVIFPANEYSSITWEILEGAEYITFEEWWSEAYITYQAPGTVVLKATAENGAEATCTVNCIDPTNYPESVELLNNNLVVNVGSAQALDLVYSPDNYDIDRTINWTIDDPNVVRIEPREDWIDGYGWQMIGYNIVGENFGNTAFRGEVVKKDGTVISTVYGEVTVEGLRIVGGSRTIFPGESFTLDVEASSDAILGAMEYVSENPNVVTISDNGVVEAVSYGETYVYVRAMVDDKYYQSGIWVKVSPDSGTIVISPSEATLYPNGGLDMSVVFPDDEYSSVTWEIVEGDCVAFTYDYSWGYAGVVYTNYGTAVIKATTEEGLEAYCTVNCIDPTVYPESVELLTKDIVMSNGTTVDLDLLYSPDGNDVDRTIVWEVADPSIAEIEPKDEYIDGMGWTLVGYEIKADNLGTTTFTGKVVKKDGTVIATLEGSVVVEGIKIEIPAPVVTLEDTFTIELKVSSEEIRKVLKYASSNPDVAIVSEDGVVTTLSYGHAYIYAYAVVANETTRTRAEGDGEDAYYEYGQWITVAPEPGNITIIPADATLTDKNTESNPVTLEVIFPYEEFSDLTWEIVDGDCVAFDRQWAECANIYYLHDGTATIKATTEDGREAFCTVNCITIYPESVELVNNEINFAGIQYQQVLKLDYTYPDGYDDGNKTINWTVDDENVAVISEGWFWNSELQISEYRYYIESKGFGTTTFRGETLNGLVVEGTVTVNGIEITNGQQTLTMGEQFTLNVNPSSPELLENIRYYSLNDKIATVSEDGVVTAIGYGYTWIGAETEYNGEYYWCDVYVNVVANAGTIELSTSELTLTEGQGTWIRVIYPAGESFPVTWESSNEDVVGVDGYSYEAYIYYVGRGKATITATAENGATATCEVTCMREGEIMIESLTVSPDKLYSIIGYSSQLNATILPEDATDKTLVWESSDPSVASVDENGKVSMHRTGSAVITVSTTDGSDLSAQCVVEVFSGVEDLFVEGEPCDIYTVNGVLVKKSATADDFNKLSNGLYIIRCGGQTMKVLRGSN